MESRRMLLKKSRLYAIIDKKSLSAKPLSRLIQKGLRDSSIDIIQYRDKVSDRAGVFDFFRRISRLLSGKKVLFIINDYVDVAKIADTDGVHLGQGDISLELARKVLGPDKIIGISCHNLKQAMDAQRRGADYIGIGPVFSTPTKPQAKPIGSKTIKSIAGKIKIPFFAIGGIDEKNICGVLASGARRVAVSRAVCKAGDIVKQIRKYQ